MHRFTAFRLLDAGAILPVFEDPSSVGSPVTVYVKGELQRCFRDPLTSEALCTIAVRGDPKLALMNDWVVHNTCAHAPKLGAPLYIDAVIPYKCIRVAKLTTLNLDASNWLRELESYPLPVFLKAWVGVARDTLQFVFHPPTPADPALRHWVSRRKTATRSVRTPLLPATVPVGWTPAPVVARELPPVPASPAPALRVLDVPAAPSTKRQRTEEPAASPTSAFAAAAAFATLASEIGADGLDGFPSSVPPSPMPLPVDETEEWEWDSLAGSQ